MPDNGRQQQRKPQTGSQPNHDYKLPYQSLPAEQSVLGCILLDDTAIEKVQSVLKVEDFYSDIHAMIYSAAIGMKLKGKAIDTVTMADELLELNQLGEIGGAVYLMTVVETVPYAAHVAHYADIVKRNADRRNAENALKEGIKRLESYDENEEVVAEIVDKLQAVLTSSLPDHPETAAELLSNVVSKNEITRIQTWFMALDAISGGVSEGSLIILAARPSVGKTALAISIIRRFAQHHQVVLFFSVEMPKLEVMIRLASVTTGLSFTAIESQQLNEDERLQLMEMQEAEWLHRIHIDDDADKTVGDINSIIHLYVRQHGIKIVVIDYLQLIKSANTKQPREQQVAEISRELKGIAKKHKICIICLAQLNREVDKRDSQKPRLSDLRESGAIEQDADQVWLLWRPKKDTSEDDHAEIVVAKSRNGQTGVAKIAWHGPTMTYSDRIVNEDRFD